MTARDVSGIAGQFDGVSRYDLILAAIPLAFFGAVLATALSSVSMEAGMAAASTVGALAVGDAIFRHPPTNSGGVGS
jgi:multidrug efflux pump subunit AcrB